MTQDIETTDVIFRIFPEGDVIALFPGIAGTNDVRGDCSSYMHVGQHSAASVFLASDTKPATPAQYAPLARELTGLGYKLRVVAKFTPKHYTQRAAQVR
jgi:hypothetical protein